MAQEFHLLPRYREEIIKHFSEELADALGRLHGLRSSGVSNYDSNSDYSFNLRTGGGEFNFSIAVPPRINYKSSKKAIGWKTNHLLFTTIKIKFHLTDNTDFEDWDSYSELYDCLEGLKQIAKTKKLNIVFQDSFFKKIKGKITGDGHDQGFDISFTMNANIVTNRALKITRKKLEEDFQDEAVEEIVKSLKSWLPNVIEFFYEVLHHFKGDSLIKEEAA
ncbi:hypothetical protein HOE07_01350 [archaeon]|jgi:hypothetical protein|nr:hypothetical protein [archaeon]